MTATLVPMLDGAPDVSALPAGAFAYRMMQTPELVATLHHWTDNGPAETLHPHTRPTVTVVLAGTVNEHTPDAVYEMGPGTVLARTPDAWHRIELVTPDAWTLYVTAAGPSREPR